MTFEEFLIQKYPLYKDRDIYNFHVPLKQVIKDVEEWLEREKVLRPVYFSNCTGCGHKECNCHD